MGDKSNYKHYENISITLQMDTLTFEAESVAYTVCQHFGIDTSEYSFAYVAGWSSGKEMPELRESMDTIRKTASQLITGIEEALKELQLEKVADLEMDKIANEEAERPARALDESEISQPLGELQSQVYELKQEEIKEAGPITLIVAECSEYHALGECHEGLASVQEAIAYFDAIPPERLHGIKSIGLDVPQVDDEYSMEIDVLVGHTFDLDMLNYVSGIKDNDQAMEMIAQLIDHYPEMEIRGEIPPLMAEKLEQIQEGKALASELAPDMALAFRIDEYMKQFNPYEYADQVENREAQVQQIAEDLNQGDAGYLVSYFKQIVEEEAGTDEDQRLAGELIREIEEYKPLAKIEELVEENYNHIDNTFNNMKRPAEERAEEVHSTEAKQEEALEHAGSESGRTVDPEKEAKKAGKRPSLRKRLEEKKAQVAAKPEKPAPEKEKAKNNERSIGNV